MLSRLVIAFLPRSKRLLISWLQSSSAVILEPKKIKFLSVFIFSPFIFQEEMGQDALILVSKCGVVSQLFHSPLSLSSLFSIGEVSSAYLKLLIFLPEILIPACPTSSLAFCVLYSAYEVNRQGDNIQP